MNAVISDDNKQAILDAILAAVPFTGANCTLMLFDTIVALDHATSLPTLEAHELAFAGYARQVVSGWTGSALMGDFHARSQAGLVTFVSTDGADSTLITGWALVDEVDLALIQSGLYDTPFTIAAGATYSTTPFFTYTGEISSEP